MYLSFIVVLGVLTLQFNFYMYILYCMYICYIVLGY
jgi:hypothetical protein